MALASFSTLPIVKKRRAEFTLRPTDYQWGQDHGSSLVRGPLAVMAEHLQSARRAYIACRQTGEYGALFFQEPLPEDFLGEDEDGSLRYRTRSYDGAHTVVELGLAHLHGYWDGWSKRSELPAAADLTQFIAWVAEAEQALWQDYYAEEWPHTATVLREMQLAAQAWREVHSVGTSAEAAAFAQQFTFHDAVVRSVQVNMDTFVAEIDCRWKHTGGWLKLILSLEQVGSFCLSQPHSTAWYILFNDLTVLIEGGQTYIELGELDAPQTAQEIMTSRLYVSGCGLIYRVAPAD